MKTSEQFLTELEAEITAMGAKIEPPDFRERVVAHAINSVREGFNKTKYLSDTTAAIDKRLKEWQKEHRIERRPQVSYEWNRCANCKVEFQAERGMRPEFCEACWRIVPSEHEFDCSCGACTGDDSAIPVKGE
jgi:hypothetical protein